MAESLAKVLCALNLLISGAELRRADIGSLTGSDASFVEGNNIFAMGLYQTLKSESGNVCVSPYSISELMPIAYAGARGNTEKQIADVLHFRSNHIPVAFKERNHCLRNMAS